MVSQIRESQWRDMPPKEGKVPLSSIKPASARAYWATAPAKGEIRRQPLEAPLSEHILARTHFSGISKGTETKVATGGVPQSERERMRCPHQSGNFPFPVKYGYCSVAEVIEGPRERIGEYFFALFPHQDRYWLACDQCHFLPKGLPPARAILAANMETALNAVWDAQVMPGDRVIVIGAGTLGSLIAWILTGIAGCEVGVCDINASRSGFAAQIGADFVGSQVRQGWADLAIHTSASEAGLLAAIEAVGDEGIVVEASWHKGSVSLPLDGAFHSSRLTLRSSQVGQLASHRRPRWSYARRMAKALDLLAGAPVLDQLITHQIGFDELPETMARLSAGWSDPLTIRVDYR